VTKPPSARTVAGWRWHLGLGLGFTALAVLMTWPLGSPTARVVPDMDDAFFSIWRLAWVAHQLVHQPTALFDANIFYPARHALAYSDAMLLVGLVASPFLWAGVPPAIVHNGLLIAALATSAWAAAVLAHRLTSDRGAAVLAGVIVGFAPYRFTHIAHLELQWLVWMPLALLALHALVERPRPMAGLALGACLAGQLLCSVYYGVFLGVFVAVAWIAMVAATGIRSRLVPATAAAAIPLALVALPYLTPYAASRSAHGPRTEAEVAIYSATPADYLRVPSFNALRGRDDPGPAPEERALYPGLAAVALAIAGLWRGRGRTRWIYAALAVVAFDASLGVHGVTFRVLQVVAPPLGNLRAPARFASLGLVALAALASIGVAAIRSPRPRAVVAALAVALCLVEFWPRPLPVRDARLEPMPVDRWLATLPDDAVILELPVPRLDRLWFYEPWHQVRSIHHWRHLVNGYSGFLPTGYGNTLADLETFPDANSVARLGRLSVDYVIVRRANFDDRGYAQVTAALLATPGFAPPQVFGTGREEAAIYPLVPREP
jgi:hypothetical protein